MTVAHNRAIEEEAEGGEGEDAPAQENAEAAAEGGAEGAEDTGEPGAPNPSPMVMYDLEHQILVSW